MIELHINEIEALWVAVNIIALTLTVSAFIDARRNFRIVKSTSTLPNYPARFLIAQTNIRREIIRVGLQALFLILVVPGLFADNQVPLNPFVLILIAMPVLLMIQTLLDTRDRGRINELVAEAIEHEQTSISNKVDKNTEVIERLTDEISRNNHSH